MDPKKIIPLEDRIPKLKQQRRQRANRRLIFYLSIFFFLLLAVIYFQSSLSDIKTIRVDGNIFISEEDIISVSGLKERTSFWNVDKERIQANIESFTEIKQTSIKKIFPNTVHIEIMEYPRVAYLVDDGKYFPILENGQMLDELPKGNYPYDAPLLVNWEVGEELAEMAAELIKLPDSILHRISEIYHTPVESDPLRLQIFMNDGFEVSSTIRHFSTKILPYLSIVKEIEPGAKGIIHMRINPYFEHFDDEEEQEIENEG